MCCDIIMVRLIWFKFFPRWLLIRIGSEEPVPWPKSIHLGHGIRTGVKTKFVCIKVVRQVNHKGGFQ